MSAKTRREYMKFALPGKPLESSLDQGDQRAGKAVSATALGQLDRGPDLDFVNDLSQFRVTGILALAQDTRQVLELAERHLAQPAGQGQFLEAVEQDLSTLARPAAPSGGDANLLQGLQTVQGCDRATARLRLPINPDERRDGKEGGRGRR